MDLEDLIDGDDSSPCFNDKDLQLDEVAAFLKSLPTLLQTAATAFRNAINYALNGSNTGRWDINDLNKTEKSLIGVLFETEIRRQFGFGDGTVADVSIAGHDVGVKFSLSEYGWMFAPENVDQISLVTHASEEKSLFKVGLIRTGDADLRGGSNRDKKVGLLAAARDKIRWIIPAGRLPENILYHTDPEDRKYIFEPRYGTERIRRLFERRIQNVIGPTCIRTVGYDLHDPIRRVRTARDKLAPTGLLVLGSDKSLEEAHVLGYPIERTEYVCVPESEFLEKGVSLPNWYKEKR